MAVLIEEFDLTTLKRRRPIVFDKIDVTPTHNEVGPFVLDIPANSRNWELIQLDAADELIPVGLVLDWNGVFTAPLKAEDWAFKRTIDDEGRVVETLTLIGSDCLCLLANRIPYPNPAAAWSGQTVTTTTYTGNAETVIKNIVTANLKTATDTARRVPQLTVAPNLNRGGAVTYKVVTPNPGATSGTETATVGASLMDMVRAGNAQSPMGVRITLGDGELILDCYVPRDLTDVAVFSPTLGNLPEATLTVSEPTGNAILLQSNVTSGKFTQVNGNGAANPWRRVEQFADQSSTDTAADITTAGNEALADGASKVQLALTVVDLPRLRFGADTPGVQGYREGDSVVVDIRDGVTYSDLVFKVQLVADTTGDHYSETVTPTIGQQADSSADQTINAKTAARLRALEKALRRSAP